MYIYIFFFHLYIYVYLYIYIFTSVPFFRLIDLCIYHLYIVAAAIGYEHPFDITSFLS